MVTERVLQGWVAAFLKSTDFTPAIERWAPELLGEVRGIAEGADLPFETIFAFQLADEVWVNGREVAQRVPVERCSAVGIARSGTCPAIVARNVDVEGFRNGFQTVLHIAAEGGHPEQFVFTFAGYWGANGMNNRSIGICANALPQLRHGREGLPVAFIIRTTLEQRTCNKAAFLSSQHRM